MTRLGTDSSSSADPIHRLFDEVLSGARDLDVLDELLAPDYLDHSPAPGAPSNRAGVRLKVDFYRMSEGRIAEHRGVVDEAGSMAQLGEADRDERRV